jgi:hypothetical protein
VAAESVLCSGGGMWQRVSLPSAEGRCRELIRAHVEGGERGGMHCKRAGVELGTSLNAKRKPLQCGQGWCVSLSQMRMARRERRIGACWGAAGEEDVPTCGAAGMASSEVAGMASAGEALTADGAGLAEGSLLAAEGGGFEAGVE